MQPYTIEEIKRRITPVAEKHKLPAVYLFGSYARGEATADSDVDLLVDISGTGITGFAFGGLYADFEDALGTRIDLVTLSALERPSDKKSQQHFRDAVRKERVILYAGA